MISPEVGGAATLTKMSRVAMLASVMVVLALVCRKKRALADVVVEAESAKAPLPFFLAAFALLVVASSIGWILEAVQTVGSTVLRACLAVSIAALSVETSLEKLVALGWRPIAPMAGGAIFAALYMLTVIFPSPVTFS